MIDFSQILQIWNSNFAIQLFFYGAFGGLAFRFTLFFRKDLNSTLAKEYGYDPTQKAGFFETISMWTFSIVLGGFAGLISPQLFSMPVFEAYLRIIGFFLGTASTTFFGFFVKLLVDKGSQDSFWLKLLSIFFEALAAPIKKLAKPLESVSSNDDKSK